MSPPKTPATTPPDPPRKKGRGRPAHEPTAETRRQVKVMAGIGQLHHTDMAKILGIHDTTLRKHYRDELENGLRFANHAVAANMYKQATGQGPQCVAAARFWLERRAGWRIPSEPMAAGTGRGVLLLPVTSATMAEWEQVVTHHSAPGGGNAKP